MGTWTPKICVRGRTVLSRRTTPALRQGPAAAALRNFAFWTNRPDGPPVTLSPRRPGPLIQLRRGSACFGTGQTRLLHRASSAGPPSSTALAPSDQQIRSHKTTATTLHPSSSASPLPSHQMPMGIDGGGEGEGEGEGEGRIFGQPPPNRTHAAAAAAADPAPLAMLSLTKVLRSLLTTTVSSSPFLLAPSLRVMSFLASTTIPVFNPDRNPLLRFLLKKTFYAQFCAGEHPAEVRATIAELRSMGFSGVILGYAREVVLKDGEAERLLGSSPSEEKAGMMEAEAEAEADAVAARDEVESWTEGIVQTVMLASPGDFVAFKFTGSGRQALQSLSSRQPPAKTLADTIDRICALAQDKDVRLLFDAEQQALQPGIDDWTLMYMRRFNSPDRAVVYGTYQAYLKAMPTIVSQHLAVAAREGFCLGVKLVRGAYLGSDPRHLIHDTKTATDECYDGIARALLTRKWVAPLTAPEGNSGGGGGRYGETVATAFPQVNMVLASHNRDSVLKGRAVLDSAAFGGTEVAFAQLQGMADEVSCELIASASPATAAVAAKCPQTYKYLVWGTTGECMKYLLRRAQENRDAVQRTRDGRVAMQAEVVRRVKRAFGVGG